MLTRLKLLCSLLLVLQTAAVAQEKDWAAVQKKIVTAVDKFHDDFPREKVFVQTDRNVYAAGETIWMKAWLTHDGKPSPFSRIVYIDLVNEKGNVIEKKMYRLDSLSTTACDITIPQNTAAGNYRLRGYSLWMMNFTADLFSANIFITDKKIQTTSPVISNAYTLSFFPEGGYLVQNVESVVGFKLTDKNGNSISNTTAEIKSNTGKTIAAIKTEHNGMGSFLFTPLPGETYTAYFQNNPAVQFNLPAAEKEGVVLKISNISKSRVSVIVKKNTADPLKYNRLLIVAQMHQSIVYIGEVNFEEGATGAAISKKDLPPGIMQVTLFDDNGTPLAERVAFVNNIVTTPLDVSTGIADGTNTKGEGITVKQPSGTLPNLSLCVVRDDATGNNPPENFLSSLFLSSDINGEIENPNYYLTANDSAVNRHMDLLMLTHGWRRYKWKELLSGNFPSLKYPVEQAMAIKGNVTVPGSSQRILSGKVDMFIKGADSTSLYSVADLTDRGEFIFDKLNLRKEATIYYQGTNAKKEKLVTDVNIYPNYIDTLKQAKEAATVKSITPSASNDLATYFNRMFAADSQYKSMLGVTLKTFKRSVVDSLNSVYTTGQFATGGRQINPDGHYFNIWQLMRTIPGFTIEGSTNSPTVTVTRAAGINVFGDNTSLDEAGGESGADMTGYVVNGIAYYLNEVPVSKDVIDGISMNDVAYIKTYVGAEATIVGPFNGVISVYTQAGKGVGNSVIDKVFAKQKILGYAVPREFYVPAAAGNNTRLIQPTLLWVPNVRFNKKGEFNIAFDGSSLNAPATLLIQGIDAGGRMYYYKKPVK